MTKLSVIASIGCSFVISLLSLSSLPLQAADPAQTGVEFFENKIRPLLISQCFECHSAGKKKRGGLLLDNRAAALKGGDTGPAFVPGKPEESLMIQAVCYLEDLKMPPRGKLPKEQIADLTTWVKMGAPWPGGSEKVAADSIFDLQKRKEHWSFQPITRTPVPTVKDSAWPRNDIDRYILAKLEAKGLKPAEPADKRTLLRRVTFDLTGLPPTPAEIDAFLKDQTPNAYETVVERLLASPSYGERWARHWLDLVRFAETLGHEFDVDMAEAYRYRDYVIRAFNADIPYDRFVTEHLAGDLLPEPRRHPIEKFNESIQGTGFWFLGESKHSPVDLRVDGADRRDNQIDVFAKTFLGLTVSCARCHDHKFDAILTRDYYGLASYLQSSRYQRAFIDDPERFAVPIRKLTALREEARPLAIELSAKILMERLDSLASTLLAARGSTQNAAADKPGHLDAWLKAWRPAEVEKPDNLFHLWQRLNESAIQTPQQFAARKLELLTQSKAQSDRLTEYAKRATTFADFRRSDFRDWFVTGNAFGSAPSKGGELVLQPDAPQPIRRIVPPGQAESGLVSPRLQGALRSPTFTIEKKHILYRVSGRGVRINLIIDGFQQIQEPIYGGLTFTVQNDAASAWKVQNVGMWIGLKAYIEVLDDGDGKVALERVLFSDDGSPPAEPNRLWLRLLEDPTVVDAASLARKYQELLKETVAQWRDSKLNVETEKVDRISLLNEMLGSDLLATLPEIMAKSHSPELERINRSLKQIHEVERTLPVPQRAIAMADGSGLNERVHIRGSTKNLGADAPRQLLVAIAGDHQPIPVKGSGRLELARRLLDGSDPLPTRVMVNRLWHHHFGKGLVASTDDFGIQGQRPTHPELLDWLATEFVKQGWSIKQMHRLMVLSSTYRMASRSDQKTEQADPQNDLLHRMPIRRLEAEAIRDAMLSCSGRLNPTMFGPGPRPNLTEHMQGRGRPGSSGPLDGAGRRSIYLNVRRNFLNPMFLAFDYPIPFTTIGRRGVSNVPAQALTLLNNPFVVQQAQEWAKRVAADAKQTPRERIASMYVTAFGRAPNEAEIKDSIMFLEEQSKEYGKPDDPRAWADLCHVLFNVKEFIFVN